MAPEPAMAAKIAFARLAKFCTHALKTIIIAAENGPI